MSARDGGPLALAYVTATLHGDHESADAIRDDLSQDVEALGVALSALAGFVFGTVAGLADMADVPIEQIRDEVLADMGRSLATLNNEESR